MELGKTEQHKDFRDRLLKAKSTGEVASICEEMQEAGIELEELWRESSPQFIGIATALIQHKFPNGLDELK